MNKIIKIFIGIIMLLIIGYFGIFYIQNYCLMKSFERENDEDFSQEDTKFIRCNLDITNPVFAFTFDIRGGNEGRIAFYRSNRLFSQTEQEWDTQYTGGTTITNTNFSELVKMVKEDCSQFKKVYKNPDGINWGYREAELPRSPEAIEYENEVGYYEWIKQFNYKYDNLFTDLQKEKFTEFYGDFYSMTDEEQYNIAKEVMDNGGIDNSLHQYFIDSEGNFIEKK